MDRRANVPSYKKRLSAPGGLETAASNGLKSADNQNDFDQNETEGGTDHYAAAAAHSCLVTGCSNPAAHSLRRKCIRKSVKKFLLKFDVPTTAACIWLCQTHYDTVIQCSGCVLCKRRLGKNHMYHITSVRKLIIISSYHIWLTNYFLRRTLIAWRKLYRKWEFPYSWELAPPFANFVVILPIC